MWTSKQKSISYDEAKTDANRAQKDIKLGPFDVTRKIFSAEESSKMTIQDQFSLFFNDYSLIPLFSQENYVQVMPRSAKLVAFLCHSDFDWGQSSDELPLNARLNVYKNPGSGSVISRKLDQPHLAPSSAMPPARVFPPCKFTIT